jgi:thiol:disulfide interchange protein
MRVVVLLALVLAAPMLRAQEVVANKHLYSEAADAKADIAAAEVTARRQHKRILLDFGGNWCGDCQLLDTYYHSPANAALLAKYYVVVHVDIGHVDKNLDVAAKYGVPIDHGVPGLGIIDPAGKVVYGQKAKEFEHTSPELVTALLEKWKPVR